MISIGVQRFCGAAPRAPQMHRTHRMHRAHRAAKGDTIEMNFFFLEFKNELNSLASHPFLGKKLKRGWVRKEGYTQHTVLAVQHRGTLAPPMKDKGGDANNKSF